MRVFVLFFLISFSITANAINENKLDSSWYPLSTDISFGEQQYFSINGDTFNIELLDIQTTIDTIKEAIRSATVTVRINKDTIKISCGNYSLPITLTEFGIQIDCPVVRKYLANSNHSEWEIEKDARLRIYPYIGRFIKEGVFGFPMDVELFSSKTHMTNEPIVNAAHPFPKPKKIYYHSDLDFFGANGLAKIYSTTDAVVLSVGTEISQNNSLPDAYALRLLSDQIITIDPMGFYHVYAHLDSFATNMNPGLEIKKGNLIGFLGKKGGSANKPHFHYAMHVQQPSGLIGTVDAYPFIVQSYIDEYKPTVIAVARPHKFTFSGDEVLLSAKNTINNSTQKLDYEWSIEGRVFFGKNVNVTFDTPGSYSAILKAYNDYGQDYDSVTIKVFDKSELSAKIPNIIATFYPTTGIEINTPIGFYFRTTNEEVGKEDFCTELDFGDGTIRNVCHPKKDYNSFTHSYSKPGHYIVRFRTIKKLKTPHNDSPSATEFLFVKVYDNN